MRAYATESGVERYTVSCDIAEMIGQRVRVLDDDLNPRGELGAWYVTGRDPRNSAHVIVAKVGERGLQSWSLHHGLLRVRS